MFFLIGNNRKLNQFGYYFGNIRVNVFVIGNNGKLKNLDINVFLLGNNRKLNQFGY
jgi:hypothetical protein